MYFSDTIVFSFTDFGIWALCIDCLRSREQGLSQWVNTLRPRQNGRHFPDDTFKRIFLNENVRISITISLKFDPEGPINKIPALVQIMAWRRPGDKPLSEPMMVRLLTHIYVIRPQWVKTWHMPCLLSLIRAMGCRTLHGIYARAWPLWCLFPTYGFVLQSMGTTSR